MIGALAVILVLGVGLLGLCTFMEWIGFVSLLDHVSPCRGVAPAASAAELVARPRAKR